MQSCSEDHKGWHQHNAQREKKNIYMHTEFKLLILCYKISTDKVFAAIKGLGQALPDKTLLAETHKQRICTANTVRGYIFFPFVWMQVGNLLLSNTWCKTDCMCTLSLFLDTHIVTSEVQSVCPTEFTLPQHTAEWNKGWKGGLRPNSGPYIIRQ